ncbi:MAG: N-6 DNA methylase [Nocardioidaceae bacterium]
MNLYLHEIEDFKVVRGDTLRSPGLRNPDGSLSPVRRGHRQPAVQPSELGSRHLGRRPPLLLRRAPGEERRLRLGPAHGLLDERDTGRVGVVMPHGVLFRGGVEAKIRQCLVEQDQLEAVIGLPPNLFYSTSIPACLLIFRASKPEERRNHVLFVDGSARFAKGRNQNFMSDDDTDADPGRLPHRGRPGR